MHEACYSSSVSASNARSLCPSGGDVQVGAGAAAACDIDGCGHGTQVAAVAAGSGGGVVGIAPRADIMAIQVFLTL